MLIARTTHIHLYALFITLFFRGCSYVCCILPQVPVPVSQCRLLVLLGPELTVFEWSATSRTMLSHWFNKAASIERSTAAAAPPPPPSGSGSPRATLSHSDLDDFEVRFIDDDSDASSPFSLDQPPTPKDNHLELDPASATMPMTSPIDIATPTRNASSSPSSQGQKPVFHDPDLRASAMMTGTPFDSAMARGRQDSFGGAKPISMNNPNRNNGDGRPRRESLAGSLVGGMSWGGVSVGSWIRDE